MTQYLFNTGSTLNVSSIPEFANLNTQQLPMDEIRILVDTSIPRTVILPYSAIFPVRNVKITVVDITGNAGANNITVQASACITTDRICATFVNNLSIKNIPDGAGGLPSGSIYMCSTDSNRIYIVP